MSNISVVDFLRLSNSDVAELYCAKKGENSTMIFAYDGTRRSFLVSQGLKNLKIENSLLKNNKRGGCANFANTSSSALFDIVKINNNNNCNNNKNTTTNGTDVNQQHGDKQIKINYLQYSKTAIHKFLSSSIMMFNHGIKNIVYPMWFCTLERRGPEYLPKFIQYLWGFNALLNPEYGFMKSFQDNGVRVLFYGEFKKLLQRVNDQELLCVFEQIMEQTKHNTKKFLLLGTNIESPSQTIIDNTITFYKNNNGKQPTKQDLIKQYYGVQHEIEDVSFYLGFDRFSTDGRPILIADTGDEDQYWTVSPHSFLSTESFRNVIYDHLYQRSITNAKEYELKVSDIEMMKEFYENNSKNVMGVGNVNPNGNYWYPSPQVKVPQLKTPTIVITENHCDNLIKQMNEKLITFFDDGDNNINYLNNNNLSSSASLSSLSTDLNNQYQYSNNVGGMGGSPPSPRSYDNYLFK